MLGHQVLIESVKSDLQSSHVLVNSYLRSKSSQEVLKFVMGCFVLFREGGCMCSFFDPHKNISCDWLCLLLTADIISTVEFNYSGDLLATGDKGGRVVIFQREQEVSALQSTNQMASLYSAYTAYQKGSVVFGIWFSWTQSCCNNCRIEQFFKPYPGRGGRNLLLTVSTAKVLMPSSYCNRHLENIFVKDTRLSYVGP